MQGALGSLVFAALSGASQLQAQGLQPAYVSDSFGDKIWLCQDGNSDGDFNDAGEVTAFYDDMVGPIALSSNQAIAIRPDGGLLVSDSTEDKVLLLLDLDGNGDAHGSGEATVFFDGDPLINLSGITMASARGMMVDSVDLVWVAVGDSGSGGRDMILRLQDLDGDGNANGAGEASVYFEALPGAAVGESIPVDVKRGLDGALYYLDSGVSTARPKGVYRLEDLDGSGTIDQPGEETPYFFVPQTGSSVFHWSLQYGPGGRFYLADTSGDVIWGFEDTNGDKVIDPNTEAAPLWTAPGSSNIWSFQYGLDGTWYVAEDQSPDRLLRFVDMDGNGVIDPATEVTEIYNEGVAPTNLGSPRGIVTSPMPPSSITFCDPANTNSAGLACRIAGQFGTGTGANLRLTATQGPPSEFGYFLVSQVPDPVGTLISNGRFCLGAFGRYNVAGSAFNSLGQFDGGGVLANLSGTSGSGLGFDVPRRVPMTGSPQITSGSTWHFQLWYRDGAGTSNFSNGLTVTFP